MTTVFDGNGFAKQRLENLRQRVAELDYMPKLVSVVFQEDSMGMLYTNLKAEAAKSVGIGFEKVVLCYHDSIHSNRQIVVDICEREDVTGVLVQKPNRNQISNIKYQSVDEYVEWWQEITSAIDPAKDVDCLTRENLEKVYSGESKFLPATAKAVVSILESEVGGVQNLKEKQIVVVGRSELVGKPLMSYFKNPNFAKASMGRQNLNVKMLGSRDDIKQFTSQADIIISATGQAGLITGEMVKEGVTVIDVGEPKGDVEFASVSQKASFITPVPGGVGPVTVVSLLENLLELVVV